MDKQKALRVFGLFIADIFTIVLSVYGALVLRFNGPIETMYLQRANSIIIPILIVCYGILYAFEMYKGIWKYASIAELWNIIFSSITSTLAIIVISYITGNTLPASCYLMILAIFLLGLCGSRYSYRLIRMFRREYMSNKTREKERVLIYGAGSAGEKILREITNSTGLHKEVVCFIDDDDNKWARKIHNVRIKGGRDILKLVCKEEKIDEIIVAMPAANHKKLAEVLNACKETKCRLKRVPGYYQILNGDVHLSDLKDVEVQDLLGRDQIEVNLSEIMEYVKEKRRSHPLSGGGRVITGIELERNKLREVKDKSDIIIDTSKYKIGDLREEMTKYFGDEKIPEKQMSITVLSFGFKYGIPVDSDLVFDVRFIPNPFYIPELKPFSGLDAPVRDYVLGQDETKEFLGKLTDMLEFLIPNYKKEGKRQLIIAIGCTGGRHRSVAIANEIYQNLHEKNYDVYIEHRDIKEDVHKGDKKL